MIPTIFIASWNKTSLEITSQQPTETIINECIIVIAQASSLCVVSRCFRVNLFLCVWFISGVVKVYFVLFLIYQPFGEAGDLCVNQQK
jgi:hypothetical protein